MSNDLKKAIAVLDMDLTLSALQTADDASLRKFFSLACHWLELADAELEKRGMPSRVTAETTAS
jgi:hypothetical protein